MDSKNQLFLWFSGIRRMVMSKEQFNSKHALDIAKEITVAAIGSSNTNFIPNAEIGKNVADFFKAIYECVLRFEPDGGGAL